MKVYDGREKCKYCLRYNCTYCSSIITPIERSKAPINTKIRKTRSGIIVVREGSSVERRTNLLQRGRLIRYNRRSFQA